MNISDNISRYKRAKTKLSKIPDTIDKIVSDKKDVLLSLNRDQLLFGRNADGELLSPTYQQDPYFKTKAHADNYAKMKYSMESWHNTRIRIGVQLFPTKPKDTPNLIVTGDFQDNMFILTGKGEYDIGSTYKDTPSIESKYNKKVFGLSEKSRQHFYDNYILKVLKRIINGL